MADVEFGYVYDFGAGEEFAARRGEGATLDGEPIRVAEDAETLELLGVEAAEPARALPALEALAGKVYRLRVVGSIAISLAYVAAGRFDAMLSLRLLPLGRRRRRAADRPRGGRRRGLRRAGGLAGADLGLDARYPIAAAAGERGLAVIHAAQQP